MGISQNNGKDYVDIEYTCNNDTDIIIMFYLQDISMQFLDETNDDPIRALNKLVGNFEEKLSVNGKKYDSSYKIIIYNRIMVNIRKCVENEKEYLEFCRI